MARSFTPKQASKALFSYEKKMRNAVAVPFRKSLSEGKKRIIASFKERGIGRGLWGGRGTVGKSGKKLKPAVKLERVRFSRSNQGFIGGIKAKGIAAIIEKGGRLRRHTIAPRRKKFLKFEAPTGTAFAKSVSHPGARVPRRSVVKKGLEKVSKVMPPRINASLQQLSRSIL